MEKNEIKFKPTVAGKTFYVQDGEDILFQIEVHETLPEHFWVIDGDRTFGYKKTTVWEQIDRKQWIIQ